VIHQNPQPSRPPPAPFRHRPRHPLGRRHSRNPLRSPSASSRPSCMWPRRGWSSSRGSSSSCQWCFSPEPWSSGTTTTATSITPVCTAPEARVAPVRGSTVRAPAVLDRGVPVLADPAVPAVRRRLAQVAPCSSVPSAPAAHSDRVARAAQARRRRARLRARSARHQTGALSKGRRFVHCGIETRCQRLGSTWPGNRSQPIDEETPT
jgi:hypothetical protein